MKALFFAFLAFAVFFGTCFGKSLSFKADYVMRNTQVFSNGYITGTVYYRYNDKKPLQTVFRFDSNYNDGSAFKVDKEIYHFTNAAVYSICFKCSASSLSATAEPWYHVTGDDLVEGSTYQRPGATSANLVEFTVDANNRPTYLKFKGGREYTLSNFEEIAFDSAEFNVPTDCPKPECRTYADIVFVLDNSGSVNNQEWSQAKDFVQKVIDKFTLSYTAVAVGVVLFSGPYDGYCSWWEACIDAPGVERERVPMDLYVKETKDECDGRKNSTGYGWAWNETGKYCRYYGDRFLSDCKFEQACNVDPVKYPYLKVALPLSHNSNDVGNIPKIYGNTCQGLGLAKAYEMLFETNYRCRNGKCPTPMVIAVSDGDDLCRNTTTREAQKLRDAGAYLFEVGVGLEAEYDVDYIRNISTQLDSSASVLTVDSFAQMKTIIDNLVSQVCEFNVDASGTSCGMDCKGFCACGTCVCPECADSGSKCSRFECDSNNAWNGCMSFNESCRNQELEDTKCYKQWCDATEGCKVEPLNCYDELEYDFKECESIECVSGSGCSEKYIVRSDAYCQSLSAAQNGCRIGKCNPKDPDADSNTGCVYIDKNCSVPDNYVCTSAGCDIDSGECKYENCLIETRCMRYNSTSHKLVPFCPAKPCEDLVSCNDDPNLPDTEEARCTYKDRVCDPSDNICLKNLCDKNEDKCVMKALLENECVNKSNKCYTYSCDPSGNEGHGSCVAVMTEHEVKPCYEYECHNASGWESNPKCSLDSKCKISMCIHDVVSGTDSCLVTDVSCVDKVNLPSDCFYPTCNEKDGCTIKRYSSSYYDICGNCVRTDVGANVSQQEVVNCVSVQDEEIAKEGLAAAAIALIVLGAIIIGAAIAGTSVLGTKALIDRARAATNQTAVSNPLFEDSQTEMANPAYLGQD